MNGSNRDPDDWVAPALVWGIALVAPPVSLAVPAAYYAWRGVRALVPVVGRAVAARAARAREERQRREARLELARQAAEAERLRVAALPPPPPTAEELAAQARARYEAALRALDAAPLDETERRAGREHARLRLLRELDGLMR